MITMHSQGPSLSFIICVIVCFLFPKGFEPARLEAKFSFTYKLSTQKLLHGIFL